MWPVAAFKGEPGGQVALKILTEATDHSSINSLLVGHILSGESALLLLLSEEPLLAAVLALLLFCGLEVGIVVLGGVHLGHINLGGSGNHVGLVDAAEGHTVQLEGASHEEQARRELSEEHHTLALEATCKEDEDGSGGDGRAELGGVADNAARQRLGGILGGIVLGGLGGGGLSGLRGLGVLRELATVLLLDGPQTTAKSQQGERKMS